MEACYQIMVAFACYSFLGWLCESIYCSIPAGRFINRGFLMGPFCPIYGVGAILVAELLQPFGKDVFSIFVMGMIVTSVLEYVTSVLLEKLFHTQWWDYSHKKWNIKGRVCLKNSVLFGLLCVVLVLFLCPMMDRLILLIPKGILPFLAWLLILYFVADTAISVHTILQLNGKLAQIHRLFEEINQKNQEKKELLQQKVKEESKEKLARLIARKKELEQNSKLLQRRLISAFPRMHFLQNQEHFLSIKSAISERKKKK